MSIQSTEDITREFAIERICKVVILITDRNYLELENISFEPDEDIRAFVDNEPVIDLFNIHNWTNSMLVDLMDRPFYRKSMFDNYMTVEEK